MTRCLENDLIAEQRLTLPAYEVLDALATAKEGQLRMTELADAVLLSRSGVTRLVDRLERVGLVNRVPMDSDGRGVFAVLTEQGHSRLRMAAGTHRSGVARYFLSPIVRDDLDVLERVCERLTAAGIPQLPGRRPQA